MAKPFKLLVLPGDGIGPEVVAAALRVFERICRRERIDTEVGHDVLHGEAWERYGSFCRDETVAAARESQALLVGAVGGPRWDNMIIDGATPAERDGLMRLREDLETYACLRPSRAYETLLDKTPFRPEVVAGADIMVLRELCGGLPYGTPRGIDRLDDGSYQGYDANFYSSHEIRRFAVVGFEIARQRRGKLTSIDKSNVMESGILWRRVVAEVGSGYADIELEHLYADNALYQMMMRPTAFDVVLADNIFGDLASDLVASYAGSLGMLPSASLHGLNSGKPAIYEPVHGSAPDIAGRGIANPIGAILSVAMMFRYGMQRTELARQVDEAVERCLQAEVLPPDLGGNASTEQVTEQILSAL
ncbi:MAG: 3-isopropylmalate dehydrogenase [Gammaproteobacteria bacterium]|nr:3-isopropylmalate dehydrogenase [Gammaproteobacteria bacterium]MDH3447908.1 3-isopropylmalate dehydrogenase [Gammaproteobacteria bacterium]